MTKRTSKSAPKRTSSSRKKKQHITLQSLSPRAFRSTPLCSRSIGTTTAKKLRKTPRTDAKKCLGTVRLGQDGKYLYIAIAHRQRNPKYSSSTTPTGGTHVTARWEKVYNGRTGKPLKVSDLPPTFMIPS